MAIRRILVPLDGSEYTKAATDYAARIAKKLDGEVTGLAVLDLPAYLLTGIAPIVPPGGLAAPMVFMPAGGLYFWGGLLTGSPMSEEERERARSRVETLLTAFRRRCEERGARHAVARGQGSPSDQIIQYARYYDLIIMGLRTYYRDEGTGESGDAFGNLLDHTATPIIAVREDFAPREPLRAVIAFDGSIPATRALHRFTAIAETSSFAVTIVMSHGDDETARYHLEQAAEYLAAHGFAEVATARTDRGIREALDGEYIERADMVVVGPHSKGGLLDFRLGSLTKHLANEARTTLFIGQ